MEFVRALPGSRQPSRRRTPFVRGKFSAEGGRRWAPRREASTASRCPRSNSAASAPMTPSPRLFPYPTDARLAYYFALKGLRNRHAKQPSSSHDHYCGAVCVRCWHPAARRLRCGGGHRHARLLRQRQRSRATSFRRSRNSGTIGPTPEQSKSLECARSAAEGRAELLIMTDDALRRRQHIRRRDSNASPTALRDGLRYTNFHSTSLPTARR